MFEKLRRSASRHSLTTNLKAQDPTNDTIGHITRYTTNALLDGIGLSTKKASTIHRVVVCTHAKFSAVELARILLSHGIHVTFHPVDYSKETQNITQLRSMGVDVIEDSKQIIEAIKHADCAIEDGARISKIIHAFGIQPKKHFFSVEQTSGGVHYFKEHPPLYPVINVAMSPIKLDIENRRATPEKVIQSFSEVTGMLLAGKRVLILGFGSIGEGLAQLSRVLGAHVTVYDTQAVKRMFAKHQGYETTEKNHLGHVLAQQDVIIMATNTYQGSAISTEELLLMKDGAIICNAGSGRGELGLELQKPGSFTIHNADVTIEEDGAHLRVILRKGDLQKTITILGKAYPLNLHLGNGTSHDAIKVVMAMLLVAALEGPQTYEPGLQDLAPDIQERIATLLLEAESKQSFRPRYVESRRLSLSERPYGGVYPFHNELSRDANMSVVRAWFKAGSKTRGHYHRRSQEAYYAEAGTADIIVWPAENDGAKEVYKMKAGDYLLVPESYFHDVKVTSDADFECLVIATPPFQIWDQFFTQS